MKLKDRYIVADHFKLEARSKGLTQKQSMAFLRLSLALSDFATDVYDYTEDSEARDLLYDHLNELKKILPEVILGSSPQVTHSESEPDGQKKRGRPKKS